MVGLTAVISASFLTGAVDKLSPPQLNSPADGARRVRDARLSWNMVPLARKYRVSYKQNTFDEHTAEVSFTEYTIPLAKKGVKYIWRVKALASDPKNDSDWSASRSFTTFIAAPDQLSPRHGETNVGTLVANDTKVSVRLTWKSSDGATGYIPEIEGKGSPNTLGGTEYTYPLLDKGTTYKWRVKSVGPDEQSEWSPWWTFTTRN